MIFKLFSLELKKMLPNWTVRIVLAVFFVALPLLVWTTELMTTGLGNPMVEAQFSAVYKFPQIFRTVAYWAGQLGFFSLPFLILSSITMEYNYRTMRQSIITGLERHHFVLGKLILVFVLALLAVLYVNLVAIIYGLLHNSSIDLDYMGIASLQYFLQSMAYMSLAAMLAFLLRRVGLSAIIFFSYIVVIERIIIYTLLINAFEAPAVSSYFPASSFWSLIPITWLTTAFEIVKEIGGSEGYQSSILDGPMLWVVSSFYIILFWGISFWTIQKRDL
jgi:ABC-2 type transport system permease protein